MTEQKTNIAYSTTVLALFIPIALFLGCCISVPVVDWANQSDSALAQELLRKGPGRLARRCMMVISILLLPLLLRALNWKGLKDCGWQHPEGKPGAKSDFKVGSLLGLGLMLTLVSLSLLIGSRDIDISYTTSRTIMSLFTFGIGAMAAGIFEETLVRGVLYRKLIEQWNIYFATIILAIFFGWIHFLKAEDSAFEIVAYWPKVIEIFTSAATGFTRIDNAYVEMLNLGLFSALLCVMLLKTGSIWLAAGFHFGAVWVKRMNSIMSGSDHVHPLYPLPRRLLRLYRRLGLCGIAKPLNYILRSTPDQKNRGYNELVKKKSS